MEYYEPFNVGIFGLVTKQVQIHHLSRTGVKRRFTLVQSLKVMHMIMGVSCDEYKGQEGKLMLCVSTKSDKYMRSEVLAYVLDPKLDFEVVQTFRIEWSRPQCTCIYYRRNCGLILAAFNGLIQFYDAVMLNKSVWDNSKVHRPKNVGTKKEIKYIHGAIQKFAYSEAHDIIAYGGVQGKIYVMD